MRWTGNEETKMPNNTCIKVMHIVAGMFKWPGLGCTVYRQLKNAIEHGLDNSRMQLSHDIDIWMILFFRGSKKGSDAVV